MILRPPPVPLRRLRSSLAILAAAFAAAACSSGAPTQPPLVTPPTDTVALSAPPINREFRGLWIATVANIDWPSRSALPVQTQQAELLAILDRARAVGLNAVVLQIRAAGDALYPSTLEPWSRSLTGRQGGDPGWDPLAFAVSAAHQRGLELHAWFNPFRAGNASDSSSLDALHLARRAPSIVRLYCGQLWFEPASALVQDHAIAVVSDVITRYGVDAVHIDDYFYPYPSATCPGLDFPDAAAFQSYVASGGTLARADWRRDNVNRFVERLYTQTHALRPWVRVGISPFGIWRPGNPAGIVGLDAYASIYADARLWLQRGWLDYLAPQLYWSIASTGQSFTALLDWWGQQNTMRRHLWPGLAAYRVADGTSSAYSAGEIAAQVATARQRAGSAGGPSGTVLYNTTSIMSNRDGLATLLTGGVYAAPAIVPASPWLGAAIPAAPSFTVLTDGAALRVTIAAPPTALAWWLVRWRNGTGWSQRLVAADTRTVDVPGVATTGTTDAVVVNSIDRVGNASPDATWRRVAP